MSSKITTPLPGEKKNNSKHKYMKPISRNEFGRLYKLCKLSEYTICNKQQPAIKQYNGLKR